MSRRLRVVRKLIDDWLGATAPRPVTVVSACAGDGRDLLGVLAGRADADRVTGTLVEMDPVLASRASDETRRLGLPSISVLNTDAGASDAYESAVPADLVLMCGVFGNVSDDDARRVVTSLPQLCRRDALVVWTRHRRNPDLTPTIRSWLSEAGFDEVEFIAPDDVLFSVGAHRFRGDPAPLVLGRELFAFNR